MSSTAAALLLVVPMVAVVVVVAAPAKLPPDIKTCKQTDSNYKECLKDAVQNAIPTLAKGIPALGTQPIDPLKIVALSIAEEKNKPVAINLDFTDLDIIGISKAVIDSIDMAPGSHDIKINAHVPDVVTLLGNYKVDGKVLVLTISGQGKCNITLSDPVVELVLKGAPINKDGNSHLDVKDFKFTFTTNRLYMQLDNLFNGDQELGDNMNKFLNENWEAILKELQPSIEEALALAFKDTSNRLFHKAAYDDIFPPK